MKTSLQSYLRENARHGTPDFPAGFYSCLIPRDFQDLPTHWHEELEFTLVRSGCLKYTVGPRFEKVSPGDLLLIGPDTMHSAHQIGDAAAETDSIVFHLSLAGLSIADACTERYIQPVQKGQLQIPPVIHPGEPVYEELLRCFLSLWECRQPELMYRELLFKAEVLRLLRLIWQCSDAPVVRAAQRTYHPYEEKIKLALSYIQEHYTESITVGQLADLCGFSQVHFMNVFKTAVGSTCIEYLIEYRLALAAIDLRETNHSVMQVALDNGFQNISYFNRIFKKKYHETPSSYRKSRP